MKYSLKWYHQTIRQLQCYFFGHNWKSGNRRKTKYYGLDRTEVPYGLDKETGNYMWEYISWWSNKCTRCRTKLRVNCNEDYPWYINVFTEIAYFKTSFIWSFNWYLFENEAPRWKRIIICLPMAWLHAFGQSYFTNFNSRRPSFPAEFALYLEDLLYKWMDIE